MSSHDEQYLISQPLEIQSILSSLLRKRTLVRLGVPNQSTSVISTILHCDAAARTLYLDNAASREINTRLLASQAVKFQASLDRILIEFSGPVTAAEWDGGPAFGMAWPQAIQRLQRREYFRVEVPSKNPAIFKVNDPAIDPAKSSFPVSDISAGGLRLIDNDYQLGQVVGQIFDGRLDMPDVASVELSLRILRTAELTLENGKVTQTVACKYFNLPTNKQITIQQYIGQIERALMAKRWALE